jgi:hypothetical protein
MGWRLESRLDGSSGSRKEGRIGVSDTENLDETRWKDIWEQPEEEIISDVSSFYCRQKVEAGKSHLPRSPSPCITNGDLTK